MVIMNDFSAAALIKADDPAGLQSPSPKEDDLNEIYYRYFSVKEAVTADLVEISQKIRYQVYCIENPYEESRQPAAGAETDEFDTHASTSVLFHLPTGMPAGTVRMVVPLYEDLDNSFAIQRVCKDSLIRNPALFPVEQMGEISRFCVPKDFRRRAEDKKYTSVPNNSEARDGEHRRVIPNMTLGLIEWLVRFSVREGLSHWCAVMEPRLLRLLGRLGIYFDPIGDLVEFHGLRQPCYIELKRLLERVQEERPDVWSVISASGTHYQNLLARQT